MAALAFPLDLIESGVFWRRSFRLRYRQEVSRVASGGSIRKDFGRPLWMAEYSTKVLRPNQVSAMRARIDALDGGIQTFKGYDPARCRPIAYPEKVGLPAGSTGTGRLSAIFPDNKRIQINELVEGYTITAGDLIQIGDGDLYSVVQGGVAASTGVIEEIEVRPFLWTGTAVGSTISFIQPGCLMAIDPGSISEDVSTDTGRGSYSFQAWEVRP